MIYQGTARYPVREAVLHTAALPTGWYKGKTHMDILEAFWHWHTGDNGWRKIGYHRIVMPDGTILHNTRYLRSLWEIGAGVLGHNRGVVHVCMINVNAHHGITCFEDYFTKDQKIAVKEYLKELAALTDLQKVTGHNDYASRECPGFKVKTEDWI